MLRRFVAFVIFSITLAQLHCVGSDPDPAGPDPTATVDAAGTPPPPDSDASVCAKCDDNDPCTTDTAVNASCDGACAHVYTCPQQISLDAVADSTLDESQPAVNTGAAATLQAASSTKQKLAIVRFDPFANGRTYGHVDRAVLRLTVKSASLFDASAVAELVKTAWSESVVSWSSAIQTEGSVRPLERSTTTVAFDVTPWVQNWNANSASNFGIAIAGDGGSLTFASREDPANAPKLELIVNARSVSLPVAQDTYLNEVSPTTNFGTDPQLTLSANTNAYTRVLASYDLSALPPNATVLYAEAVFKLLSGRLLTSFAYPATGTWAEQVVTWKTSPPTEPKETGMLFLGADGRVSVDVTSALVRWQSKDLANNGLLLKNDEDGAGPTGTGSMGSRESTTRELRPTIEVLYE